MGSIYKKQDDGSYVVTSDSGSHTIERESVLLDIVMSDARRSSSRGIDELEAENGITTQRFIRGSWKPDSYRFEFISEEGEKRAKLPVSIQIAASQTLKATFSHFEPIGDMEEQFSISAYLPEDWFDWLWNEMGQRPKAIVGLRARIPSFLSGIEAHMYYEDPFKTVRLERKKHLKLDDLRTWVSDGAPDHVPSSDQGEAETSGALGGHREEIFDSAKAETWLKRIFVALVIVGLIVLIKH